MKNLFKFLKEEWTIPFLLIFGSTLPLLFVSALGWQFMTGMIYVLLGFMFVFLPLTHTGRKGLYRLTGLIMFLIGVILIIDLRNTEVTTIEIPSDQYTLEETDSYYIFNMDGYRTILFDKDSSVVNTEESPLKVYNSWKTDRLGFDFHCGLHAKSKQMEHQMTKTILQ